jgi:sodium transport system ATP-binding protein
MIHVEGLCRSFGKVRALDGVSFDAPDGQVTGILGPNGAGKTTTLRVLYTLLRPDAGSATIDGFDVQRQSVEVQRRLGVLPHAFGLYPRLTPREHLRYFGGLRGVAPAELEARIDSLSKLLDMGEVMDRRAEGFSQGQKLRVAIACALVHEPSNIVLDEPTSGLDVAGTRAMRGVIRKLRDEGRCVLFSSHVMQEVSALCDRVVVIARGKVVAHGTPDELRAQTGCDNLEDAFVAAIGSEEGLG